ncbi:pigment epithelium-derived factor isoform X2 [Osmerus eperlanus]
MRKTILLLCLGAVLCFSDAQLLDEEEAGGEEEPHVELFTTARTKMAAATSDFGYNLFRALASQDPKANVFLAPISVSEVMTQLAMGASERAQRQLFRALRYHSLQDPQLHQTLKELLRSVSGPRKGLSTAARIYLARRIRVKPEFFSLVEKQYGVRPKAMVGGAKDMKDINDWVKQQTGGLVERLLSKPLGRSPGVIPVSAAHFKGKWMTRFSQTGKMQNFQLDGEAPVSIPMMQQENYPVKMGIDSDLSCTIAQIQMQDDVSMFVFLPDDVTQNMTLLEESLTAEFVQDLSMNLPALQVDLTLPVLKLSSSTDLLPLLPDLGLSDWLAETELEKITAQAAKLSSVNHKVVMEMAPEGVQYAGLTPPTHRLLVRVDRPFLFLVRDEASGALLLVGRMVNPKDLRM